NCDDCWRSRRPKSPSAAWGYGSGKVDAIDFQTNGDVILQGYRLWGVKSGSTTFQVTIRLYRGSSMIAEKTGSYFTRSTDKTFEVHFSQVISIRAGLLYTATAEITGARSHAHSDGMSSASCSGVTVTFIKSSKDTNNSNVSLKAKYQH
ncbi:PHR domain, partial [Desmophyllum pertusum]